MQTILRGVVAWLDAIVVDIASRSGNAMAIPDDRKAARLDNFEDLEKKGIVHLIQMVTLALRE